MSLPQRRRGEVYFYKFPDEFGGPHAVVIVSRDTGRDSVLAAYITSPKQPEAVDIIPIQEDFDCHPALHGFVRCDRVFYLAKDDPSWSRFVLTMSDADMERVATGLRGALQL